MNRKIICIVIALLVLSVSAIIVASPVWFISTKAEFGSTLNGFPVWVEFRVRSDKYLISTMDIQELRENWGDHVGRFVRFTGVVESVKTGLRTGKVRWLTLEGDPFVDVYLPDSRKLPETYELWHKYEFTGFLTRYEAHTEYKKSGYAKMRVYAFAIRHLGETD